MILTLGMKHQAIELYKVCIYHAPGMTLTFFTARSAWVAHAFEWAKLRHLKGKTCCKLANGLNLYDLKKEIDSRGCSDPALGLYTCILPF